MAITVKTLIIFSAVVIVSFLIYKHLTSSPSNKEVILFHADFCGHCKVMKPNWEKAVDMAKKAGIVVKISAFEHSKDRDHIQRFNVRGYPTIIKFPRGSDYHQDRIEYSGDRSTNSIYEFLCN